MRVHAALATFVIATLGAWQARAQEAAASVGFADHLMTIDGVVGLGTPVGGIGLSVMANPASWVAAGAGVGVNSQGLQLAALTRLRPFFWERRKRALAIPIGLSLATGPYKTPEGDALLGTLDHSGFEESKRIAAFDRVYWFQPDVGFELQAASGFHLLAAVGAAIPLGFSGMHCVNEMGDQAACSTGYIEGPSEPTTIGTMTVALGAALP